MYFYELHEGDDDLMTDVILARDTVMPPEDFYELVQEVRERIQDSFEEDSLVEAIAAELEREHDFLFVSDDRIVAAVRVSAVPEDDSLVAAGDEERDADVRAGRGVDAREGEEDEEDEGGDDDELPDWVTVVADLEPPTRPS